jgi:hypothetical protein
MSLTDPQTLILLVGVLLLASPALMGSAVLWIKNLLVVQLLQLKNRLEKEGCTVASDSTKDLVFALVYGEKPKKD